MIYQIVPLTLGQTVYRHNHLLFSLIGIEYDNDATWLFLTKCPISIKFQSNKKQEGLLFICFSTFQCLHGCLIVLGTDVMDEGHGVENEKLDSTVTGIEGVELVRLFEEQLLQEIQFLPDILSESVN